MVKLTLKRSPRAWITLPLQLPLFALQLLTVTLIYVLTTIEKAVIPKICTGLGQHFYWPFVIIVRVIAGSPRWMPVDLQLGRQPRTDEERLRAAADPHVVPAVCACANPDCENKKRPYYAWVAVPRNKSEIEGDIEQNTPNVLMQVQKAIVENAEKAAAYDTLMAEHLELKQNYARSVEDLLALRQRVEEHAETMRS